jgi:hypothetical protein
MVRCGRGSRWVGSIKGGDCAGPVHVAGSGVMTCTIRTHREDRAAHADSDNAAVARAARAAGAVGAGRQRMW